MTHTESDGASRFDGQPSQNRTVVKKRTSVALVTLTGMALGYALAHASHVTPARAAPESSTCSRSGAIWWNELLAPETEKLTAFYAKVIGWKTKSVDAEDQSRPPRSPQDQYTIFMDGDQEVAGLMRANHPESVHSGNGWFTYIQVADVDVAAEAAKAAGGTILREPTETGDGTQVAVVSDPMGNVFGLVTPGRKGPC
jgi:uncharacterized protein